MSSKPMHKKTHSIFVITSVMALLGLSTFALAHDPSMHQSKEQPQCGALQEMDESELNSDDPVMMAMRKQCEDQMQLDADGHHKDGEHHAVESHMEGHHDGH